MHGVFLLGIVAPAGKKGLIIAAGGGEAGLHGLDMGGEFGEVQLLDEVARSRLDAG